MKQETLTVIAKNELPSNLAPKGPSLYVVKELSVDTIRKNLLDLSETLDSVLEDIGQSNGKFSLEEISLNVEISGSGKIQLIGAVEAGVKGGITLTFKKSKK